MSKDKRFVNTPRVEIGSPQYEADAALMKLFDSYEEYLSYTADWQKGWTSYHPSIAPTATYPEESDAAACASKTMSRAYRRKRTVVHHKRSVRNSEILDKKVESTERSKANLYKRERILQPQCIGFSRIYPDFNGHSSAFLQLFETYDDYLDYLADCYGSENSGFGFAIDVTGLRISERSIKAYQSLAVKANAYGKRVACLFRKKNQETTVMVSENSTSSVVEANVPSVPDSPCKLRNGFVVYRCKARKLLHIPRGTIKETELRIVMERPTIIPVFF